jgi:FkbM family methyltransferase
MFQINDKISRNILVSSDHGLMCVNRFDYDANNVGSGQSILQHGNSCTIEASACIETIKNVESPVIFDIGANIGTFTTWVARYFNNGKIYCFEPQRLVFQILCANLAINNLHNAYTYNIALGDTNSRIKILEPDYNIPADFGTFSLVKNTILNKNAELIIDMYTLDDFAKMYEIQKVDFIKIDTEGMDLSVLRGSVNLIKEYRPSILIEFFDNNDNIQIEIENFLSTYGYKFRYLNNNILALPELIKND